VQPAHALGEDQTSYIGGEPGGVLTPAKDAHRGHRCTSLEHAQYPIDAGRLRRQQKDALAPVGGARDDLGCDARLARYWPALNQTDIRRSQRSANCFALPDVQGRCIQRPGVNGWQLLPIPRQDARQKPLGSVACGTIGRLGQLMRMQ
jgi:hypothetical protein